MIFVFGIQRCEVDFYRDFTRLLQFQRINKLWFSRALSDDYWFVDVLARASDSFGLFDVVRVVLGASVLFELINPRESRARRISEHPTLWLRILEVMDDRRGVAIAFWFVVDGPACWFLRRGIVAHDGYCLLLYFLAILQLQFRLAPVNDHLPPLINYFVLDLLVDGG